MFFPEIVHATQYYRAPTPLPEEWEGDISAMKDFALDAFQIRINWRWNERKKGEYDFSDVDKLMDLAERQNRKVIVKLLLESAPQYVFDECGGTRIGPRGEALRGGSHGAFYGGWRPCFTNPVVEERATLFVEEVAKRYSGRKNVILWNAWNEIRNKPIEDCFCPHCRRAFGKYLQGKFQTVEKLNAFYGTAEESFESIALPAMPHGYWDIYEFKKFKGSYELARWLKFVKDAIRKYDKTRPVMSHVGFTSAFQRHLGDVCDDYEVSKAVDFWGTSVPCDTSMRTREKRQDFFMLNDFLRSVDENYFVHEIYPGLGMFRNYDTPFDMQFKTYASLASGAKGIVYWQYRAERLGMENDCAGLMRADGSPREVAYTVKQFGEALHRDMQYFSKAKLRPAEVAIVFDFDSMLLSEIEDSSGDDFSFALSDPLFYYRYAHAGLYRMLDDCGFRVDYVNAKDTQKFKNYRALFFPYHTMLSPALAPVLKSYCNQGGTLFLDEGFGMRQENTWFQPYDIACKELFTARLTERRRREGKVILNGQEVSVKPYVSAYRSNGKPLFAFDDGTPAATQFTCGKGKAYLFGFSVGYSYYQDKDERLKQAVKALLPDGLAYERAVQEEVSVRRADCGAHEIIYCFNASEREASLPVKGRIVSAGGSGQVKEGALSVPAKSVAYVVKEK